MKRKILASCVLILAACGALEQKSSTKSDSTSTATATEAPSNVQFTGYVQKAFTITVNGNQFADSEDFYTQFIDKLVKPQYPDVKDKDVEVDGAYGLSEFGTNSGVYMSSTGDEGHLYQGTTDGQSKFAIQVQAAALDETFKARVVVRIGLVIKAAGADDLHYCYLLSGEKDSIQVSDKSKPIIFDSFTTELTTYKCDSVSDSIAIPGLPKPTVPPPGNVLPTATETASATATASSTSTSTNPYPPGPVLPVLTSTAATTLTGDQQ